MRKRVFSHFCEFCLLLTENSGHIYRQNKFDLNYSCFDDKYHYFCNYWAHFSSSAYVKYHMDMQSYTRIKGGSVLILYCFFFTKILDHWNHGT